jgi:hypothetical protein
MSESACPSDLNASWFRSTTATFEVIITLSVHHSLLLGVLKLAAGAFHDKKSVDSNWLVRENFAPHEKIGLAMARILKLFLVSGLNPIVPLFSSL